MGSPLQKQLRILAQNGFVQKRMTRSENGIIVRHALISKVIAQPRKARINKTFLVSCLMAYPALIGFLLCKNRSVIAIVRIVAFLNQVYSSRSTPLSLIILYSTHYIVFARQYMFIMITALVYPSICFSLAAIVFGVVGSTLDVSLTFVESISSP